MRVFVTGATGFVGNELIRFMTDQKFHVKAGLRIMSGQQQPAQNDFVEWIETGDLSSVKNFSFLKDCQAVIHLAGRAHIMSEKSEDPEKEYDTANRIATENLARSAKASGVQRFIFISTIKVNGERTSIGRPFRPSDNPNPSDFYSKSKLAAEKLLMEMHEPGVFEVVIIRPPLIYGRNPKGNLNILSKIIRLGIPLPFANTMNRRSLVHVLNLSDFIVKCLHHSKSSGQIFLVADATPYSLPTLIRMLAKSLNRSTHLFPFPQRVLQLLLNSFGMSSIADRLLGNLEVDLQKNQDFLGWRSPFDFHGNKIN